MNILNKISTQEESYQLNYQILPCLWLANRMASYMYCTSIAFKRGTYFDKYDNFFNIVTKCFNNDTTVVYNKGFLEKELDRYLQIEIRAYNIESPILTFCPIMTSSDKDAKIEFSVVGFSTIGGWNVPVPIQYVSKYNFYEIKERLTKGMDSAMYSAMFRRRNTYYDFSRGNYQPLGPNVSLASICLSALTSGKKSEWKSI